MKTQKLKDLIFHRRETLAKWEMALEIATLPEDIEWFKKAITYLTADILMIQKIIDDRIDEILAHEQSPQKQRLLHLKAMKAKYSIDHILEDLHIDGRIQRCLQLIEEYGEDFVLTK